MRGLGLNPNDSELHDLIAEADVNKDGSVDFNGVSTAGAGREPDAAANHTPRVPQHDGEDGQGG